MLLIPCVTLPQAFFALAVLQCGHCTAIQSDLLFSASCRLCAYRVLVVAVVQLCVWRKEEEEERRNMSDNRRHSFVSRGGRRRWREWGNKEEREWEGEGSF